MTSCKTCLTKGVYFLHCAVQNYDWGKLGSESKVAKFISVNNVNVKVDVEKPYAELWMGTHPNGPCYIESEDGVIVPFKEWLREHPKTLGCCYNPLEKTPNCDLPFLFKVLSIRKALSIQAHPDKDLAAKLHASRPEIYKDPNHKPEMALAVTPFEALGGFRPVQEIANFLRTVPELAALVGKEQVDAFLERFEGGGKPVLRQLFKAFAESPVELITQHLGELVKRLQSQDISKDPTSSLVLRLFQQFPNDIGCFCVYFLNYVLLKPGEAIFLGANQPHAYLSGDCVECMAASDNVVRAGLTPKLRDVKTLVQMLNYKNGPASSQSLGGVKTGNHSLMYDPPIDEFSVLYTKLEPSLVETLPGWIGPCIAIVTEGHGTIGNGGGSTDIKAGHVLFIESNTSFKVQAVDSELTIYFAYCEGRLKALPATPS